MKRKQKQSTIKKRLWRLLPVAGVVVLLFSGLSNRDIELPVIMPISHITVEGELEFLDRNKMMSLVSRHLQGGYFTVELQGLRKLLLQQPWVQEVTLRRKWPAGLDIYIEEKHPVAYWNKESYISDEGDVFTPAAVVEGLAIPELSGPEGHHKDVWTFMNVLYGEMAILDYQVSSLVMDKRRAWQLVIQSADNDEGITVKLGRFETEKRLQRFVHLLPTLAASPGQSFDSGKRIKVIDMRYPNGFAVQLGLLRRTSVHESAKESEA